MIPDAAIDQAKKRLAASIDTLISVNISPVHFRTAHLYDDIVQALYRYGLPLRNLELEITEGAAMFDPDGAIVVPNKLHDLGVRVAIDDFGIGYSSLNHLKRFRVDKLKIDKSFVDDVVTDANDRAIVRTIIAMARNLHLEIIAEGVETMDQLDFLVKNRCDLIQGYLFSKPLRAEEFYSFWHVCAKEPSRLAFPIKHGA